MAHLSQSDLVQLLARAANSVQVGSIYEHYKGQHYKVIGLAIDESTDHPCVIYQAQHGDAITFVRLLDDWLKEVEGRPRFRLESEKKVE